MSAPNKQEIMQHAHSMIVEFCLLNGDSHTNLLHAITRDIYPTTTSEETSTFHLNIKRCSIPSHHKYSRKIHIIHFSQIKWISTLEQRPRCMLPTAHHLILFFNHMDIPNLDPNVTQSIHEEFIVQCLMSMNPEDQAKWKQLLARYCIPYDVCPNYKALDQLTGHKKASKVLRQFLSKHSWQSFINTLQQWCSTVLNELQLTPNDALLYRLTDSLKRIQIDDTSTSNRATPHTKKQEIVILSEDEEEEEQKKEIDHHGLKLMSSKDSMNEEEIEAMQIEDKNDAISDDHLDLDAAQLPQSMPSLELGSQSMQQLIESTQEDDYEDMIEPLTQNTKHIDTHEEGDSPDLCEEASGSPIGASQINGDISQQSEVSTSELLQSQNDIQELEQSDYPVPSQRPQGGFNFGAFGHDLDRNELLPQDTEISETESPPEHQNHSIFAPSQMPMDVEASSSFRADYLSQNKPPSDLSPLTQNVAQNDDERGTKRRYDQMERLSDEAPLTQNVKRAKVRLNGEHEKKDKKMKYATENEWPSWVKRGIEVTVELDDDLWLSVVRKVSKQFVLIRITDEDAPGKYRQQQFKIYLKDKEKIELVMDLHETQSQSPPGEIADLSPPVEEEERPPQRLKSLLKSRNHNNDNRQKNHVRWELTLSQEQRENDRDTNTSVERSSVYDGFESSNFAASDPMPEELINREYITDPEKACGLGLSDEEHEEHRNNKFKIRRSKKKKRVQRIPWTDEEIECLIQGVEKYKKHEHAPRGKQGMWAYIMKDPRFGKVLIKNKRENANLCDKWRHLVQKKDPRVRHLLGDNTDSPKKKMPKLSTRPVR
eukprot:370598_1